MSNALVLVVAVPCFCCGIAAVLVLLMILPFSVVVFVIGMVAEPGEDRWLTKKTGYGGMNMLRVGFEAPGLIYYKWDYSGVSVKI